MFRFRQLQILLSVLCVLTLASCGKDDDDDDISPNVSLLTAGVWSGDAVYVGSEDRTAEFEAQLEIDFSKYTTLFNRNGTYSEDYEGDQLAAGTWEFQDNERTIVFDEGTNKEYAVSVTILDEDEFFYIQEGVEFRFVR